MGGSCSESYHSPQRHLSFPSTAVVHALIPVLTLFQRDDCHLCDLALAVLAGAGAPDFDSVFIDGDEALEVRYGLRVPVLRDEARCLELDWPFDETRLAGFLR